MTIASAPLLRVIAPGDVRRETRRPVNDQTLAAARIIVERVGREGSSAVRHYAARFGERGPEEPLVLSRGDMERALAELDAADQALLRRTADRIRFFASAQRDALGAIDVPIAGGRAGHTIEPVRSAACYAPAGRFPLPSSVLMTAVTARVAGCARVVVASPGAPAIALAAAAVAGADEFLAVGGAHAIAAMAHGCDELEPCDMIAGPGNKWVTAAKQIVSGRVGIDMLAGPTELLIIADDTADPDLIAADLLAQAEHDTEARPMLVLSSPSLLPAVERSLAHRLRFLSGAAVAREALAGGFACLTDSLDQMCAVADALAAEHVEIMTRDAAEVAQRIRNAGAIFIGPSSAEVLGDYGAGPNHTLPTGASARFQGGLSVMNFLRIRTWIEIDDPRRARVLYEDAAALARLEGLVAHGDAARARLA